MGHTNSKDNHVEKSMYVRQAKIGQGSYAKVFKGYHKLTGEKVALKRSLIGLEEIGYEATARREVKILKTLQHDNVVKLMQFFDTVEDKESKGRRSFLYLVLEFCQHNLESLLCNDNLQFSLSEIKKLMQQMFEGLGYIHVKKVLHRDMKPSNILITHDGVVKLADFGLSCTYSRNTRDGQNKSYSNNVISMWYRPPELLLGERNYGPSVDMWSAGCIMAEMWTRRPIMMGHLEQDQLNLISELCGSITPKNWPNVDKLVLYCLWKLPKKQKRKLQERFGVIVKCPHAMDMLEQLLMLDPSKRLESQNAVFHDFFFNDPMPCSLGQMLTTHSRTIRYQPPVSHLMLDTATEAIMTTPDENTF